MAAALCAAASVLLCGQAEAREGAVGQKDKYYVDRPLSARPQGVECDHDALPVVYIYTRVTPDGRKPSNWIEYPSLPMESPNYDTNYDFSYPLQVLGFGAVLELDGQNSWERRFHNGRRYISRFRHPMYIDAYQRIMSILDKGGRGYFQHRYVHTVIINNTSGEHVYIDGSGGYYTLGDTTARQLPAKERADLFAILRKMYDTFRYCEE